MGTPAVGNPIGASDFNAALCRAPGTQFSWNDSELRVLSGQTSGQVSTYACYGKTTGTAKITCAFNSGGNAYGWSGGAFGSGNYNPGFGGLNIAEAYWTPSLNWVIVTYPSGSAQPSVNIINIRNENFTVILTAGGSSVTTANGRWMQVWPNITANYFPVGATRWLLSS